MTQQVLYATANGEIIQWQDTAAFNYGAAPSGTAILPVTPTQWAEQAAPYYVSNGALVAGTIAPAPPTLAQQAAAALTGNVMVTSASAASTLNGTYPVGGQVQFMILSELQAISTNGTFADGTTTLEWADVNGVQHAFSIAEFKSFATAVGAYCSPLYRIAGGTTGLTLPSPNITIA